MNERRTLTRWCAGLLAVGAVLVGGLLPAQAGVTAAGHSHSQLQPTDTGWNGT